jgi:hypothetical protein
MLQSIIPSLFHIPEIRWQSTGIQVYVIRHYGECNECSYYYSSLSLALQSVERNGR